MSNAPDFDQGVFRKQLGVLAFASSEQQTRYPISIPFHERLGGASQDISSRFVLRDVKTTFNGGLLGTKERKKLK